MKIAIKRELLEIAEGTIFVAVADDAFRLFVVEVGMADDLFERGSVDFDFDEGGGRLHFYPFL